MGREVCWGDAERQNWHSLQPAQGEALVGVVMTFAGPVSPNHESKRKVGT
jgi:hypothetical protein